MSHKPWSGAKLSSEELDLPIKHTDVLLLRIKKLFNMWVEDRGGANE
jgi:hypothetical protein